jgi:hypothetical protein
MSIQQWPTGGTHPAIGGAEQGLARTIVRGKNRQLLAGADVDVDGGSDFC